MLKFKKPVELVKIPVTGSPFVTLSGVMPVENEDDSEFVMVPKRYANPLFDINVVQKYYKQKLGNSGMVVFRFDNDGYAVVAMPVPKEPDIKEG